MFRHSPHNTPASPVGGGLAGCCGQPHGGCGAIEQDVKPAGDAVHGGGAWPGHLLESGGPVAMPGVPQDTGSSL